ncbi:MAG: DUF3786 domain-containing protein [Candidatus Eremiobacteraeota bacterium]|nr:DUF3786 domain-containing protein [Candidatus Eremiobacteraeota bacterium]
MQNQKFKNAIKIVWNKLCENDIITAPRSAGAELLHDDRIRIVYMNSPYIVDCQELIATGKNREKAGDALSIILLHYLAGVPENYEEGDFTNYAGLSVAMIYARNFKLHCKEKLAKAPGNDPALYENIYKQLEGEKDKPGRDSPGYVLPVLPGVRFLGLFYPDDEEIPAGFTMLLPENSIQILPVEDLEIPGELVRSDIIEMLEK